MWEILQTDEFGIWFRTLDSETKEDIYASLEVLREKVPSLSRPRADTLKDTKYPNLKELRIQSNGRPFRIIFAFDPDRKAVLLIGGNKQGDKTFYKKIIPVAERLYEEHLKGN